MAAAEHTNSRRAPVPAAPAMLAAAFLTAVSLAGCAAGRAAAHRPRRPAPISHVVFATLRDPADAAELIRDCDARLAPIPGVAAYACGPHLDTGRPSVDGDYHVGLYIGFETEADYAAYVEHPNHTALVADWSPRMVRLRVHDVWDATP